MRHLAKVVKMANRRTSTATVVVGVAGVAAVQSFSHIYWLARGHGQDKLDSILMPLGVDGLILAMTLVLLEQARRKEDAPVLAYFMIWLGIAATVAANVIYGWRYGIVGACVSAWPAVSFIGAIHVMTEVGKRWSATEPLRSSAEVDEGTEAPADPIELARAAFAASLEIENPLSERQLHRQFGISRPRAKQLRTELTTPEMNGSHA
jgi:hypothetical protein